MKILTAICALALSTLVSWQAVADQYVHGYFRSNGTYVHPYYRSSPNNTVIDNYSYHGNINPYTGQVGHNYYRYDLTSPYFTGPDPQGRVGHVGGYYMPPAASGNYVHPSEGYSDPGAVNLCPPPHYRMTERDGCQPAH